MLLDWGIGWTTALAFLALMIEALVGYPDRLARAIGHPVIWIGRLIDALDDALNRESVSDVGRRAAGGTGLVIVVAVAAGIALALEHGMVRLPFGLLLAAILACTLIAQRSLYDHVSRVVEALETKSLAAAREAVSHIVGRDPDALDEAGVARAAIESLAENFSDGVVAPALWLALAGLPGMVAYKAVNTADSMIGHVDRRHSAFGWAAARLDDLVNLPASRLAALLLVLAALFAPHAHASAAARAAWRDARRHRSPNAGWPEGAMAGALDLALAGPRRYPEGMVADPWVGDGTAQATTSDIVRALSLYKLACVLQGGLVLGAWLVAGHVSPVA